MEKHEYTNELIHETSPYLLQHAHNPVHWMPWGEKTLLRAKRENKLLLISIGYAACHWCHVMEHESFEDPDVARVMNTHFVCIKVDREERPDVDHIYMSAVQLMTQRGGWPLNAIALPDGRPIWGGTYFQKEVWVNALEQIHAFHQQNPEKTEEYAERLSQGIRESNLTPINQTPQTLDTSQLKHAVSHWKSNFDRLEGGSKGAPKFMMPNNLQFLLHWAHQMNDQETLSYVETTLEKMARGGLYDQVGGGFARYSTDSYWKVPHFEKMLYDNAQLLSVYAQAFQKTKNPLYQEVVQQTIAFIERELLSPEGGFHSSLDADSEGEEGKFYVWQKQELQKLLGPEFPLFANYYQVNENGHWENGNYILLRRQADETFATKHHLPVDELKLRVRNWQKHLLHAREQRIRPGLDDKILTSWNALTISGLVAAYRAFGEADYLRLAEKNFQFLKERQLTATGNLRHSYKNKTSKIDGFMEDYALLIQALVDLFETTGNNSYLDDAQQLTNKTFEHFYDSEKNIFYFTAESQTNLITRSVEVHDNVIPASNSVMTNNLFRMGHLTGKQDYLIMVERMLEKLVEDFQTYPSGYSNWMQVALNFTGKHYEVALVGEQAFKKLKVLQMHYLPQCLFCASLTDSQLPLLKNRFTKSKTWLYVCQNNSCQLPLESVSETLKRLQP
ncbi:thioredoxin domain-containing protein [Sunxiuqinia sp. sy24]|uniref:thioredoxin domain-containing protein n=1 Tax=Sunxiuqinia sp. sy24 TaxID=3461495 RepID=UPI004045A124